MAICLDREECNFQNRDKARFCARCGMPTQETLLNGRYEVQELVSKDRHHVTLRAIDRHQGLPVTVRVLLAKQSNAKEREEFLQDAELAASLSHNIHDAGSIRVIDYGQDGPALFLVKSEAEDIRPARRRMTVRVNSDAFELPQLSSDANKLDDEDAPTQIMPATFKTFQDRKQEQAPVAEPDWLAEGNRAYELQHYEEALADYEAALARNGALEEAWSGKGTILLQLGRAGEALAAFDRALSIQPDNPDLWSSRAHVLHELRR